MTRGPKSSEAGFSLVEVLVTVAIVGITFVVFVGGMGTAVIGSDHHRKQAVAQAGIRNFAEAVKAAPFSADCANAAANYSKAYSPPPPARRSSDASLAVAVAHIAPSVTPLSGDTHLLAMFSLAGSTTVGDTTLTLPSGMTAGWSLRSNSATASNRVSIGFADQATPANTPTGPRVATSLNNVDSVAHLVSVPTRAGFARRGVSVAATPILGAANLSITAPSTTAIGDQMFAQIAVRGASTVVSPPPGWTLVSAKTHGSTLRSLIYERTATAVGATAFDWTFSAVTEAAGGIVSYVGVPKGYDATVTAVKYWDSATSTWFSVDADHPCPAPESIDMQLVSLRLLSTDPRATATQTIDVIKRCHEKPTVFDACQDSP